MDNNNRQNSTNINWYPGHMAKTKREIKEKIDLIDIVYEVIDARMPISSKIVDIDNLIKNKPTILIVTKYDMCDREKTDKILDDYKNKGYIVIAVDLINGKNISSIINRTLLFQKELNEKRKEKGLKPRSIRALVVGVPNVGKSTLINRLVGKKAVKVGNMPGVTKNLGWIRIHKDIELLDSPGILWPKLENQEHAFNLACLSSIKEEILNNEEISRYIIKKLASEYPKLLMQRYGLDNVEDIDLIFDKIAKKRGCLQKGGIIDYDKVYLVIIRDLKEGFIGNITFDRI